MKKPALHSAVIAALATLAGMPGHAQAQQATASPEPRVDCGAQGCQQAGEVVLRVRTRGEDQPKTGTGTPEDSAALQPDRRVTVRTEADAQAPGRATAVGKWSVQLPDGGVVWATEDPNLGSPELTISAPSMVSFDGGRIVEPVRFFVRSNYTAFVKRYELTLYRGTDADLVAPVAQLDLPVEATAQSDWDGTLPTVMTSASSVFDLSQFVPTPTSGQ